MIRIRIRWSIAAGILLYASPAAALGDGVHANQYAHVTWGTGTRPFVAYPRAIAQTTDGYLWLATESGLIRFDGYRFSLWRPPPGAELPGSLVVRLMGGRDGSLWIGTTLGLARLKDGTVTMYPELAGKSVGALAEDRNAIVWAGTNAGLKGQATLCSIRTDGVRCEDSGGLFGRFVSTLYEDGRGELWVGAATGLWRWGRDHRERFPLPSAFPEIHAIAEGADGRLLVAANDEIRQLVDGRLQLLRLAGLPDPLKPTSLLRDVDGGLWIGRQHQGLLYLHDGQVQQFSRGDGLSGEFVFALLQDREHNVWVATINGLDRFRRLVVSTVSPTEGAGGARVSSVVAAGDDTMWLATVAGLVRFRDGRFTMPLLDPRVARQPAALYEDSAGRLWVSSAAGLSFVSKGISTRIEGVGPGYIHAITEDGDGNLWVADQERGLFRLRAAAVVQRIPWTTVGGVGRSLAGDPHHAGVWIGLFEGGVRYFSDGQVRAAYGSDTGVGRGVVGALHVDDEGAAWAATEGGLSRLAEGRVVTLDSRNVLPCDRVHWAIEDDQRAMWLATTCGLVRIARGALHQWLSGASKTVTTTVFDESDGVVNRFDGGAYGPPVTKSRDGRLWFAADQGVSIIDPKRLRLDALAPSVRVEQVMADGVAYDDASVRLPQRVRDLRIDYTALALGVPEKVQFRYKLEGRDAEWISAGNRRQAFYTDLPPNTYRFRVSAAGSGGGWNEQGAAVDIMIPPALQQTWGFRAAMALAAVVVVWSLYRWRLRRMALALNRGFEERLAERTRIAQDLHDTLLQGFVSASMHLHVLAEEVHDQQLRPKLGSVLDRINRGIEEGRQTVYGLRTSLVADDLEEALARDAEFFRGRQQVKVHIVVEGTRQPLDPLVRDDVYRVLREALVNCFRHAAASRIDLEFEYGPERLVVRVRDNGRGMEPAVIERGRLGHWGMQSMQERAHAIGATLRVRSRLESGTEVELLVPADVVFRRSAWRRRRGRVPWR
jgi:signal transduction histidine kinase/ligand-binding sensor domain-containing protein